MSEKRLHACTVLQWGCVSCAVTMEVILKGGLGELPGNQMSGCSDTLNNYYCGMGDIDLVM